jgi:hypothetical protein
MTGLKTSQMLGNFGAFAAFRKALAWIIQDFASEKRKGALKD